MISGRASRGVLCTVCCLALAACGDPTSAAVPTTFATALARIHGPWGGHVEFVDAAAVSTGRGPWTPLRTRTGGPLARYAAALPAVLGVDLGRASWTLTAGPAPTVVTVVAGGQDAAAVRSAATAAGWTGDDVLRPLPNRPDPLPVDAVRAVGSDVALGGPVAQLDGPGGDLDTDPVVASVRDCLGDVAVATVDASGSGLVRAVGLRRDPGDATAVISVVCAANASAPVVAEAVRSGTTTDGVAYREYLADPQIDDFGAPQSMLPSMVRLTARNAPGAPASFLLDALDRRDLPGVSG